MTNKEGLIHLSSYDFYRKMKKMFMTMSKTEIINWLDKEVVKPDSIIVKDINGKHKCPYCGQVWVWSQSRWNIVRQTGILVIKCKMCCNKFVAYRYPDGIVNERIESND